MITFKPATFAAVAMLLSFSSAGASREDAAAAKVAAIGGDMDPQRVDNASGFDFDTGFGFVDAQRALRATRGF